MSAIVNEQIQQDGCGSIVNLGFAGKNSRKLFGYDFVKYRPDCESSNANGLLKFNDVVNFGRRICEHDPNAHNCVMCGEFDVVIPTQNKDVCKACDTSFWYNPMLNVAFKFCKGCKNFVTLEMFSDKPDASKCDRCRRRGRENYLTKKIIGAQESCSTPGLATGSPPTVSPALSTEAQQEQTIAEFKYAFSTATSPSVSTPASVLCSFYKVPFDGDTGKKPSHLSQPPIVTSFTPTPQAAPRTSNKRPNGGDLLLTNPAEVVVAFYASIPAKPPKTPRSVSYSSEPPRPVVTPRSDLQPPLPRTLNILNTPRGRRTSTVTPASHTTQKCGSSSSHGQDSTTSTGSSAGSSGGSSRSVRFARSASMGSADGAELEEESESQSHYLWDRNCYDKGSPPAVANASTPQHSYVPNDTPASNLSILTSYSSSGNQANKLGLLGSAAPAAAMANDKENSRQSVLDGFSMLHNSCARLFSDAMHRESRYPDQRSQPQLQLPRLEVEQDVKEERQRQSEDRDVCIVSPSASESAPLSPEESVPGSHCKDLRRLGSLDAASAPTMMDTSPDLLYLQATGASCPSSATASAANTGRAPSITSCNTECHTSNTMSDGKDANGGKAVSEKRQWEWDPSQNPLMHLAMITERI